MLCRTLTLSLGLLPALAATIQADDKEKAAVAAIESLGGSVRKMAANTDDQEIQFYLSDQDVTDEALKHVPDVSNVVWLNLRGTKITDAGLVHLKALTKLTRLHLEKTSITDVGLPHLAALTNLEYLNLYGTKVSDAGLEPLKGLKNLKKLYVWQTQVTQAGAKQLKETLPGLEVVLGIDLAPPKEEPKKEEPKKEEAKKQ